MNYHPNFSNLSGRKFGRLKAIAPAFKKRSSYYWKCDCECGKSKVVLGAKLTGGRTRSCGCLRTEMLIARASTHRMSKTRAYGIWNGILNRCNNKNVAAYPRYGGRGIKVCDRWMRFEPFYLDMGEPPANYSIERKDNDGDYCPENCVWATRLEQNRNSRKNVYLTINGVTKCISEWASIIGVKSGTLHARIKRGWTVEAAVNPALKRPRKAKL